MDGGGAAITDRGNRERSVVFCSNELIRTVVSCSQSASTEFLREHREDLTEALTIALSENRLTQFIAEFYAGGKSYATIVFDIQYDGARSFDDAPVSSIREAVRDVPPGTDPVVLAWPVIADFDYFVDVGTVGQQVGSFGAEEIDIQVNVV